MFEKLDEMRFTMFRDESGRVEVALIGDQTLAK
jgi:hypothetical protein